MTVFNRKGHQMIRFGRKLAVAASFACILFWGCGRTAAAQGTGALTNLVQVLYNDGNGLATSEANVILQTGNGYVWIGGYGGLVRYDGKEFYNYSVDGGGLTSAGIRALFEDSGGRLWVGTNDKGVFVYEDGVFNACTPPEEDLYHSVRCFAEDASGAVYAGTSTGLVKIDEDRRLVPVEVQGLQGETIYSLSFDRNGVLWGTAGSGAAFALKDGGVVCRMDPGDVSEYENYSVLADGNVIYISTGGNALIRLTLRDDRYMSGSYEVKTWHTGRLRTINALCMTGDGELWVGGDTGSGWFDQDMGFHMLEHMEQNTFISCIMEDYEGNLWMASTQGGVFKLTQGKFMNANRTAGLEDKSINAVVRMGGYLYAASDYGLCIMDGNWKPVSNDLTRQLEGIRIRHLCVDSSGRLWISTYGELGLICYTPAQEGFLSITEKDGLLSDKVRETIELENGDMAVATTGGINILHNMEVTESYGQEQGLKNPVTLCLLQVSDGTLLAGCDGMGIYAIRDGAVFNYGKEEGLKSGVVLRMREDREADGIWISAGSELYFMDGQGGIREIADFQYGIGSIFDILVMEEDVWLMKSSGLIIVPREALLGRQPMAAVQYGRENGLTANLTANSWNLFEDQALYLCSVNGVFVLDNKRLSYNAVPPKTAVNEVTVQLESGDTYVYQNPAELTLPRDTRRVTVRFACLSFMGAPGTVEYYLENFDEKPVRIPADQTEAVSYTNLKGGSYVFRLSAVNADGVPGETELTLPITKELCFYERPVFWAGLALLGVLAGAFAIKLALELKTRKMERRQQEYRDITDQALKTIANTIDAKDKYTRGHSTRVAGYSIELARRLGYSEEDQEKIYYIALLHDIGKIGIPDAILNKPGKLTDEEFALMREHTRIGGDILRDFTAIAHIGDGALSHHENFDGTGYPDRKSGDTIPTVARIIRVADSYDAMATRRSYRGAMDQEYILSEFRKFSGIQFEPCVAQAMIDMISEGFILEDGMEGMEI